MKIVEIVVYHPVPTLNALLKLTWRGQHNEKKKTQAAMLLSLRASESGLLTTMRSSENTLWMRSATPDCSPAMRLADWITRSDKRKSHTSPMREPRLK